MTYQVTIRKRAIKALPLINEPYFSNIKKLFTACRNKPRPQGYKKLKGRDAFRVRVADYRSYRFAATRSWRFGRRKLSATTELDTKHKASLNH